MTKERREHRQLFATIALLPFAYVPHEITRVGPPLTYVTFALVLIAAVRYRAFRGPVGAVDAAAFGLSFWIAGRLLVSPLEGQPIPWDLLARQVGAVLGGLALFRIARRAALKPIIVRGLAVGLMLMLVVEAWQLAAGLSRLLSLGYTDGFYYSTADGQYRPFGTFHSPTVFGGFMAMVGAALILSVQRRRFWVVLAVMTGVALTETRAAILALAIALAVGILMQTARARARFAVLGFPLAWAAILLAILAPSAYLATFERFSRIDEDASAITRPALWRATWDLVSDGHILQGLGGRPFVEEAAPLLGPVALLGHPHSNYFETLYRYGGVGVAAFVALLATFAIETKFSDSPLRGAGVAAILAFAVDSIFNNGFSSLNYTLTLFLLVGLGVGEQEFRPLTQDDLQATASCRLPPGGAPLHVTRRADPARSTPPNMRWSDS